MTGAGIEPSQWLAIVLGVTGGVVLALAVLKAVEPPK